MLLVSAASSQCNAKTSLLPFVSPHSSYYLLSTVVAIGVGSLFQMKCTALTLVSFSSFHLLFDLLYFQPACYVFLVGGGYFYVLHTT